MECFVLLVNSQRHTTFEFLEFVVGIALVECAQLRLCSLVQDAFPLVYAETVTDELCIVGLFSHPTLQASDYVLCPVVSGIP